MADHIDPPRRGSVHDEDFDYDVARRLAISLDGQLQTHVVSYDMDAGELVRHVLRDGHPQVNPDHPDEVWSETVKGSVTVEWKEAEHG
jgi:uncharacterized protein YabE (DUF348 family)